MNLNVHKCWNENILNILNYKMVGARPQSAKYRLTPFSPIKIIKHADGQFTALYNIHRLHFQSVCLLLDCVITDIVFTTGICRLNEESNSQLKMRMQELRLGRSQWFPCHKSKSSRATWRNQPPPGPSLAYFTHVDGEGQELWLSWKWEPKRSNESSTGSSNLYHTEIYFQERPSKV